MSVTLIPLSFIETNCIQITIPWWWFNFSHLFMMWNLIFGVFGVQVIIQMTVSKENIIYDWKHSTQCTNITHSKSIVHRCKIEMVYKSLAKLCSLFWCYVWQIISCTQIMRLLGSIIKYRHKVNIFTVYIIAVWSKTRIFTYWV